MHKLRIGENYRFSISGLSAKGMGTAVLEESSVFIRQALPGDHIEAQLIKTRPQGLEAKVVKVETPSPDRVFPVCSHFGSCGGCDLQHMAYPAQVNWKIRLLGEILRQEGGFDRLPEIRTVPMDFPWAYRSKMEFSFGQEGDRITLGLHQRASFQRIVDIQTCHIAPGPVSQLLKAVKEIVQPFPLRSYNPKSHQGFWRYTVVRSSLNTGDLMLLVVTNEGPRQPLEALAEELPRRVPRLKSLYWGVSTKVSDVACPQRLEFLFGSEVLEDQVGKIRFQIRPMNFVQPNLLLAGKIYEELRQSAGLRGKEAVYDLYCGIGLIALTLASEAGSVYGVESEAENVAFAQRTAELNGITNATFLCGKVEDLLKGRTLFKVGPSPDLVILDPPRAGLHKEVYAPLLDSKVPVVIYLSCNPVSLARDIRVLCERDPRFRLEEVQMFDFFPHTTHLEVLATLRRR